jgi:hypothetical protein
MAEQRSVSLAGAGVRASWLTSLVDELGAVAKKPRLRKGYEQILRARRLLTEQGWLDDHQLRIEAGVITAIEPIPLALRARC